MDRKLRVLLLEDDPRDAELVLAELGRAGLKAEATRADTEAEFAAALSPRLDLILADHSLHEFDTERALTRLKASGLEVPLIVVTGGLPDERAAAVMALGAYAVLTKARLGELGPLARRALHESQLRRENRRLHERLLVEARTREAVEESMSAGLLCFDKHGKVSRANRAACAMLGYSAEELHGMAAPFAFWPPGKADLFESALLERRALASLETTGLRRDGRRFDVLLQLALLSGSGGAPEGAVALLYDVSELKRARAECEFRVALLEAEHEATLDGILVVDAAGGVVSHNRRFGEIWRLPAPLLAQRKDAPMLEAALTQVRDPEAFQARIRYLYEHPQEKSLDRVVLKDGRVLERYSAPLRAPDGRYLGRAWFFREPEKDAPHA